MIKLIAFAGILNITGGFSMATGAEKPVDIPNLHTQKASSGPLSQQGMPKEEPQKEKPDNWPGYQCYNIQNDNIESRWGWSLDEDYMAWFKNK